MKRLIALLVGLVMIFSLTACGGSDSGSAGGDEGGESEAVTLTLAHIRPEGSSADLAIKEFCDEVTELSGGTITFEIYPASQLGDYTAVFERVMIGDVDMQFATLPTSVDKFFGIFLSEIIDDNIIVFDAGVKNKFSDENMLSSYT